MNRLDKISNSLSWAECLPGISVVPAIIHLICAARDRVFTPQPFVPPQNETLRQFSSRKLNDWTHLHKGVLALIPIIGNAILFRKWVQQRLALNCISKLNANTPLAKTNRIPDPLVNDPEFLERLPQNNEPISLNLHANDKLFARTLQVNKYNRTLVMNLINRDIITANSYAQLSHTLQNNPDILNAYAEQIKRSSQRLVNSQNALTLFQNLDQNLRNHPDIANAFVEPLGNPLYLAQITVLISNQDTLVSSPILASGALYNGQILFENLPENLQKTSDMAIAALHHNFAQWEHFPKIIQADTRVRRVHRDKREAILIGPLRSGTLTFKQILDKDLQTKETALAALHHDLDQWLHMPKSLQEDPSVREFYDRAIGIYVRPQTTIAKHMLKIGQRQQQL